MKTECITVGAFEVNCYLVFNRDGAVWVIDPGADAALLQASIARAGAVVRGYLMTHGHADHICGLAELLQQYPAPVFLHPADRDWAFGELNQILPYYPRPARPAESLLLWPANARVAAGDDVFEIMSTPGHTPGGVCYYLPQSGLLFSGDTLFQGTVGRTDLPGGDGRTLAASLKTLRGLPEQTVVYPGHGCATTMGAELRQNMFLRPHAAL